MRPSGTSPGPSPSGRTPVRCTPLDRVPEGLGMYYAWVGDVDESLHWYEVAPRVVWPRMLRSGLFDRVRDDARFRAGIERLTERTRVRLEQAIVQARAPKPQP